MKLIKGSDLLDMFGALGELQELTRRLEALEDGTDPHLVLQHIATDDRSAMLAALMRWGERETDGGYIGIQYARVALERMKPKLRGAT